MAIRRPIVRKSGRDEQLPAGDSVAGLPIYLRAYQQSGTAVRLNLDINYALPAYTQAGTGLTIQVVLNG